MNNQINLDENEWVTIEVARKNSIYSKRQIQKLAEKGIERIGTKELPDRDITIQYETHITICCVS